jgi:hypothetical protein
MVQQMQNANLLCRLSDVLQEQQEKDEDLQSVKERMTSIENVLVGIQPLL